MAQKALLVVYAKAGHGHQKAAEAIAEAYEKLTGSKESVELLDTLSLAPGLFGELYKQTYLLQIKYAPWMWGGFYYGFDVPWIYFLMRYVRRIMNALTMKSFERILIEKNPKTILATHFTAVEVSDCLKRHKKISSQIFTMITDYYPHYVWTAESVDRYLVAAEATKEELIKRGVAASKIEITGIPIAGKFLKPMDKTGIQKRLNLSEHLFTVLVTSGGEGIGAMSEITNQILSLSDKIQVLLVCGTNKNLFAQMTERASSDPRLKVFGFVQNMEELMHVSNLVIGKGGGLTITESFSQGKPVLIYQPIPGQEARNGLFVNQNNLGVATSDIRLLVQSAKKLFEDKDYYQSVCSNIKRLAKPYAQTQIAELIQKTTNE